MVSADSGNFRPAPGNNWKEDNQQKKTRSEQIWTPARIVRYENRIESITHAFLHIMR